MVAESQTAPALLKRTPKPDKTRLAEGFTMKANRRLNHREKRYCALIAQGLACRRAYMIVSKLTNEDSASAMATRWNARPAVQAYLAKLRAEMTEEGALSRAEKRHTLANVTRSEETEVRDKLRAVEIDNRMTGDDDPFRKAAGEDIRVSFFVVRVEEDEPRNVTPSEAGEPNQLPAASVSSVSAPASPSPSP